jgi:hypothetical protein
MMVTKFAPEQWLETTVRGLKEYAEVGFDKSIKDHNNYPAGHKVYEIIMEFPSTDQIIRLVPLPKIVVHFEIDDIDSRVLGFGDGFHRLNYDELFDLIQPQEAGVHEISLDVGLWASDRSGGLTGRLRAFQTLRNLFHGPLAYEALKQATTQIVDGGSEGHIEILEFQGGRFLQDTINDLEVFRLIDCSLKVRVFSRTPIEVLIPTIEEVTIVPELIIDDNLQLPMALVIGDSGEGSDVAIGKPKSGAETGTGTDTATKTP